MPSWPSGETRRSAIASIVILGRARAVVRGRDLRDQRLRRRDRLGRGRQQVVHVLRDHRGRAPLRSPTAWTRPISRARAAEKRAPVRNSSRAAERPIFASAYGEITAGRMPSLTSVNAEQRVLGGDDDVADRGEAGAAAERRAVDAADERNRQPIERLEHPRHRARVAHVLVARVGDHLRHPRQVRAGAEHLARAREHRHARGAVGRHRRRPRGQLRDQLLVERVAHLRPIERDADDRTVRFN